MANGRASEVSIYNKGLELEQVIGVDAPVLDIAIQGDAIFVSSDAKEGSWIQEFQRTTGKWEKVDSSRWNIGQRDENTVELYWLETMRKRVGQSEQDS